MEHYIYLMLYSISLIILGWCIGKREGENNAVKRYKRLLKTSDDMVELYKSVNRSLTDENYELKEKLKENKGVVNCHSVKKSLKTR